MVLLVVVNAAIAYLIGVSGVVTRLFARDGGLPPGLVGVIGILFGLFVGFNSSDIGQHASGLRLAVEREGSDARSLLDFASGRGPREPPAHHHVPRRLYLGSPCRALLSRLGGQVNRGESN